MIQRFTRQVLRRLPSAEILKRSGAAFAIRMGGVFFTYLFSVLVSARYGKEGYGTFALSLSVTVFFITAGKLGFDTVLLRLSAYHHERDELPFVKAVYRKALMLVVPFCLLLTLIYYFSIDYLCVTWLHKPEQAPWMRIAALYILPNVLLIINTEGLRGLKMVNHYMVLQFMGIYLLNCGIMLAFYGQPTNPGLTVAAHSFSLCLIFFISWYLWHRKMKPVAVSGTEVTAAYILQKGRPLLLSNLMFTLINMSDLVVPLFCNMGEVGIYSFCLKISNFVAFPLLAVASGAAPAYARLQGPENREALQHFVLQTGKVVAFAAIPIAAGLVLFGPFILGLINKGEFAAGAPVLAVLALSGLVTCLSGPSDSMLQMTGHETLFRNIIFSAGLVSFTAFTVLVPLFGITGAAFANLVTVVYWNGTALYFIKKRLGLDMNFMQHALLNRK